MDAAHSIHRVIVLVLFAAVCVSALADEEPLFLFRSHHETIISHDVDGEPLYGEALRPLGFAHTDRVGRLHVTQGAYIANYVGQYIQARVEVSREFSLQIVFTTGLAGQSGDLLSFGNEAQRYWSVSQWAGDLRFKIGGSNARTHRLLMIPESTTLFVTLVYKDGQLTCYRNDRQETGPLSMSLDPTSWVEPTLVVGDTLAGDANWSGSIDQIGIYDYALTRSDILGHLAEYRELSGQRARVTGLKLRARLTKKSTIPTVEQLAPYTQSLGVFEYAVDEVVDGDYDEPIVYVAHWTILDSTPLPHNDAKLGEKVVLLLEHFQDHPYLQTENLSDTAIDDFALPLFFDAGQLALGGGAAFSTFSARTLRNYTIDPETSWPQTAPLTAADRNTRRARVLRDRTLIEARRLSLGGWKQAQEDLSPFYEDLRSQIRTGQETQRLYFTGEGGHIFSISGNEFLLRQDLLNVPTSDGTAQMAPPAVTIVDLSKQLLEKGIHLIVVPVPSAEQIYPDYISSKIPKGIPASPASQAFIEYLLQAGVEVVDLLPIFEKARSEMDCHLFLRTDGHWSSCGIQLAADELYERLERYEFVRNMGRPAHDYTTRDIIIKLPLATMAARLPDAQQSSYREVPWNVEQVLQSDGTGYQDDPDAPILIVGDSFTLQFYKQYGHLSAQLSKRLGRPVASYMSYASGPQIPRVLARLGKEYIEKRKVIIWVFSGNKVNPDMHDEWVSVKLP